MPLTHALLLRQSELHEHVPPTPAEAGASVRHWPVINAQLVQFFSAAAWSQQYDPPQWPDEHDVINEALPLELEAKQPDPAPSTTNLDVHVLAPEWLRYSMIGSQIFLHCQSYPMYWYSSDPGAHALHVY